MSHNKLAPFANQKYISLETYRKNGQAVRTPVWFADSDGQLYVYTLADAGKAKRLRNDPRARIAPCDMRGLAYPPPAAVAPAACLITSAT